MTAQQHLDELASTLATLSKMVSDIEPSLCSEHDLARLQIAGAHLDEAEDVLAAVRDTNYPRIVGPDQVPSREDAEREFPFEMWDIMGQQPVTIVGWHRTFPGCYLTDDGRLCWPSDITTIFPSWYLDAQQAQADEADQHDTEDAVRYG